MNGSCEAGCFATWDSESDFYTIRRQMGNVDASLKLQPLENGKSMAYRFFEMMTGGESRKDEREPLNDGL